MGTLTNQGVCLLSIRIQMGEVDLSNECLTADVINARFAIHCRKKHCLKIDIGAGDEVWLEKEHSTFFILSGDLAVWVVAGSVCHHVAYHPKN